MAEKKDTCHDCDGEFPIRLLRYRKDDALDKHVYLCTACRKVRDEAKK